MPSERLYSIRGKAKGSLTSQQTKIQLSTYSPSKQYEIVEFKITPAVAGTGCDLFATITKGRKEGTEPDKPNFADQNEIAWTNYSKELQLSNGGVQSTTSTIDYTVVHYDIWLYTVDGTAGVLSPMDINYFLLLKTWDTSKEAGAVSSLRQYAVSPAQP